jgi:hypothetical protein
MSSASDNRRGCHRRQLGPRRRVCVRPPNGSQAKLRGQGPRAEAMRRGGCRAALSLREVKVCSRRDRRVSRVCDRCFSTGPKPGRASFSLELGRLRVSLHTIDTSIKFTFAVASIQTH